MDNLTERVDDVVRVMEELHRILRPGSNATIISHTGRRTRLCRTRRTAIFYRTQHGLLHARFRLQLLVEL